MALNDVFQQKWLRELFVVTELQEVTDQGIFQMHWLGTGGYLRGSLHEVSCCLLTSQLLWLVAAALVRLKVPKGFI